MLPPVLGVCSGPAARGANAADFWGSVISSQRALSWCSACSGRTWLAYAATRRLTRSLERRFSRGGRGAASSTFTDPTSAGSGEAMPPSAAAAAAAS